MSLQEQIIHSAPYPNLDLVIEIGADLSAALNHSVRFDSGLRAIGMDSSSVSTLMGVLQTSPARGYAVVRYMGLTNAIYGATVAVGDTLRMSDVPGDEGKVVPFVQGTDGHTHGLASPGFAIEYVLSVTDVTQNALGGLTPSSDFDVLVQYLNLGVLSTASGVLVVTDIAGVGDAVAGDYLVSFTPDVVPATHRIQVSGHSGGPADGAVFNPRSFQAASTGATSAPSNGSLRWIMGQALVAGNAGDVGLMLIRPQIL